MQVACLIDGLIGVFLIVRMPVSKCPIGGLTMAQGLLWRGRGTGVLRGAGLGLWWPPAKA